MACKDDDYEGVYATLGRIAFLHSALHGRVKLAIGSLGRMDIGLTYAISERDTFVRLLDRSEAVANHRLQSEPDAHKGLSDWIKRARTANARRNLALHSAWLRDEQNRNLLKDLSGFTPSGELKFKQLEEDELMEIVQELARLNTDIMRLLEALASDHS